nr:hypothetical protein [bacterium]
MKKRMPAEIDPRQWVRNLIWIILFLILIPIHRCSSEVDGIVSILRDLNHGIESLHESMDDRYRSIGPGPELFTRLDALRDSLDKETSLNRLPYVTSLALYHPDAGWIAWSGSFNPPPPEWVQLSPETAENASVMYLMDTPTRTSLVSMQFRQDHASAVFIDVAVHTDRIRSEGPTLIDVLSRISGKTITYVSPFTVRPAADILETSLLDPDFIATLEITGSGEETDSRTRQNAWIDALGMVMDPQFFAGKIALLPNAAIFFCIGLIIWIVSGLLPPFSPRGMFRLIIRLVALCLTVPAWWAIRWTAVAAIENTSSAWWPDFQGEFGWISVILPLSCLLFTGGVIRIILWMASTGLPLHERPLRRAFRNPVPASLCLCIAIILLTSTFLRESKAVSRGNIENRLNSWLIERETLLRLAMESNLEAMQQMESIQYAVSGADTGTGYPAFDAWNASDLGVLNLMYGVEIRGPDGTILDRFSPDFSMLPVTPERLEEAAGAPDGILRVPGQPPPGESRTFQIGIAVVRNETTRMGFVILQVPVGPYAVQPSPGQWGANAYLFSIHRDAEITWPANLPVTPDEQWFDTESPPENWIEDPAHHAGILILQPHRTDVGHPELIIAILQSTPLTDHFAGSARLIILGFLVMLPGILLNEIRRFRTRRIHGNRGSFTRQLLGAFVLPVILLPLVFAVTLHQVIEDTLTRQEQSRMNHTLDRIVSRLREQILSESMRYQASVEQQLLEYDAVITALDIPWVVLNAQGRVTLSSAEPMSQILPYSTIARVFHQSRTRNQDQGRLNYLAQEPGLLTAQTILPYPLSEPYSASPGTAGTFVCEIPVTGELIQRIAGPDTAVLDVYSLGTICASNQPELFNTGIALRQISGEVYRMLFLENRKTVTRIERHRRQWHVIGALQNENGDTIAALDVTPQLDIRELTGFQPQDILLISTVL